ncbi:hypothetical protein [Streptomyces sp. NPDC018584]|uniref:hypothetical protein n=1 Tax=unclassified Streptomyces TaxID=2593676 RepID=UPI0037892E84
MGRYRGTLPTALLRDDAIRPTEYTRWTDAHRRFERREKDARIMAELLESIPRQGLREPIVLGIDDRYGDVYVADGHHRAVVLRTLRAPHFRSTGTGSSGAASGRGPTLPVLPARRQPMTRAGSGELPARRPRPCHTQPRPRHGGNP